MDRGEFEYGIYFSSLEYNISTRNDNISKTSKYYIEKVRDIIHSFIDLYSNIESEKMYSPHSYNFQNAGLIQELRTVMLFEGEDSIQKIGSEQIKRTLHLLAIIDKSIDDYLNDYQNFFNKINDDDYKLLLNFSHFMSNIYEKQSLNLETSYSEEPKFHTNAIL